jgi:hypothetical protein
MVPYLLTELLGGDAEYYRQRLSVGQLALRFPGDLCVGDSAMITKPQFEGVRKGWHIDGCASDFVPGLSDHYGHINNFNVLIGVLLSGVAVFFGLFATFRFVLRRKRRQQGAKRALEPSRMPAGPHATAVTEVQGLARIPRVSRETAQRDAILSDEPKVTSYGAAMPLLPMVRRPFRLRSPEEIVDEVFGPNAGRDTPRRKF